MSIKLQWMKKNTSTICLVFLFYTTMLISSCISHIDFKDPIQVSLNVNEAKARKVFLKEYDIKEIESYDSKILFPLSGVWLEKNWGLKLDSDGNVCCEIYETSPHNLVFSLDPNSVLSEGNFIIKWYMSCKEDNPAGITRGMININLINTTPNPDTLQIFIYTLKSPFNCKDREVKFSFKLYCKN